MRDAFFISAAVSAESIRSLRPGMRILKEALEMPVEMPPKAAPMPAAIPILAQLRLAPPLLTSWVTT